MPTSKPKAAKTVKKETKIVKKPTTTRGSISAPMYDAKGSKTGTFSLPKEVFGAKINNELMAQAVRVYLANQRQGNANAKSRGEINLTTGKWYRQKGTGRARHGAKSAPIFVGGGVAHGPRAKDYSLKLSKNMKKAAIKSALSKKASEGEIIVISGLSKIEPKTKVMNTALSKITKDTKGKSTILVVTAGSTKELPNVFRAGTNIKNVDLMSAKLLNTYEVLRHKNLLFMKESFEMIGGSDKNN